MNLGVDGGAVSTVDVSAPCPAWMVPLVPNETSQPCLHYTTMPKKFKWVGDGDAAAADLFVELGVLTAQPPVLPGEPKPSASSTSICMVKTIADKKYAILTRGLL